MSKDVTSMSPDATEMLRAVITSTVGMMRLAAPPANPDMLFHYLQHEIQHQEDYDLVLADVNDDLKRQKYPYWGFFIDGEHPKTKERVEIARTVIPKVLDTAQPDYLAQLAAWTNAYMLVTNPAVRAVWRAVGFQVNFLQSASPKTTTEASKLIS